MNKIVIMRHAHAQPESFKIKNDKDRPLSIDGLRQLDQIRYQLGDALQEITLVLCSNAKRTRQTLEGVRALLPKGVEIIYQDNLYNTNVAGLLTSIRGVADKYKDILLIAHNPSVSDFFKNVSTQAATTLMSVDPATMIFYQGYMEQWKETTLEKLSVTQIKTFSSHI